jgi:xanthine dehydrogenase iron-sulfur cluster and FAD-binding subunit A
VLLDGDAVRSCLLFAVRADGMEVTTVEGIASPDGTLSPVQSASRVSRTAMWLLHTRFVISLTALLRDHPDPTDDEIREGLSGSFCRCTGYRGIVAAAQNPSPDITSRLLKPSPSNQPTSSYAYTRATDMGKTVGRYFRRSIRACRAAALDWHAM